MLCDVCRQAFLSAGPIPWNAPEDVVCHVVANDRSVSRESPMVPHHPSFSSLKSSVDLRCLICTSFWSQYSSSINASLMTSENATPARVPADNDSIQDGTQLGIHTWIDPSHESVNEMKYKLRHGITVNARRSDGQSNFNIYHPIALEKTDSAISTNNMHCSPSLDSPTTFALAKGWIEDCSEHHKCCSSVSTWHPTRLIDSGSLELADDIIISLHETGPEISTEGPYMTLSYRWGPAAPFTLNKKTYSALLTGISLSTLPRAFQDAIRVCRGVGVRYLWIDALCIFQDEDDPSDWHREASQMHTIYTNSWCTISAAVGESSLSPILRPRPQDALRNDQFTVIWKTEEGTIDTSTYHVRDKWLWIKHVHDAPVNRRAWVLQERMLSPRVLYFTETQIFWDCFEKQLSEAYPRGWPGYTTYNPAARRVVPTKDNDGSELNSRHCLKDYHHAWCALIEEYARCHLTFQKDRLMAISAMARRFATYFKDDYVAGMWRQSLENDLLWRVNSPDQKLPQPAIYVAPTWSWASLHGGTNLFIPGGCSAGGWPANPRDQSFTCIEDVQLDYVLEDDHFGTLKGGRLRMRGVLQRIQLLPPAEMLHQCNFSKEESESDNRKRFINNDHRILINDILLDQHRDMATYPYFEYNVYLDKFAPEKIEEGNRNKTLFCVLVRKYDQRSPQPWSFLLLEILDAATGTFRRLGVLNLRHRDAMEKAALSRHENEASLPCIEYRDGKHSIWII